MTLDPTRALWDKIAPRVSRAIDNSSTFLDGYPTGSSSSASGSGDRTGTLAARHIGNGDRHGDARRELERAITQLAHLVDRLAPSNAAADHLATKASDACPPGCCESCFRDAGHRTQARTTGSKLCRWCADTARSLNMDLPPISLVRTYHVRGRITTADVRRATGGRA